MFRIHVCIYLRQVDTYPVASTVCWFITASGRALRGTRRHGLRSPPQVSKIGKKNPYTMQNRVRHGTSKGRSLTSVTLLVRSPKSFRLSPAQPRRRACGASRAGGAGGTGSKGGMGVRASRASGLARQACAARLLRCACAAARRLVASASRSGGWGRA